MNFSDQMEKKLYCKKMLFEHLPAQQFQSIALFYQQRLTQIK